MSHLLSRLLLAFTIALATPLVYALTFFVVDEFSLGFTVPSVVSLFVAASFLVTAWILVWRRQVHWTRRRSLMTALSLVWSAAMGTGAGILTLVLQQVAGQAIRVGAMCWALVWVGSTALVWRETALERAGRINKLSSGLVCCPNCGYNLTGLEQARCPECGSRYTLNELFAALHEQTEDLDTGENVA